MQRGLLSNINKINSFCNRLHIFVLLAIVKTHMYGKKSENNTKTQ